MMLGIVGALVLGFCAVSQEPQRGGTLRIATSGDPKSLDLMVTTAEPAGTIGQHIFETLFAFDENFKPVPYLAESYEYSSDGLSVTFHLRKGVLFHNGEEMTADDVIASLQRWGKYGSRGVLLFEYVTEIQQLDDYISMYHNGSVEMVSLDKNVLTVRLGGACQDCPLSSATLHGWVAGTIRQFFPEITEIRSID